MPVSIIEEHTFSVLPEIFFAFVTNPQNMTTFVGYGPIPAIKKVIPITSQQNAVGARYRIENSDSSTHEEQVTVYNPPNAFALFIGPFTSPFRHIIHHMTEEWILTPVGEATKLKRTFVLYPTNYFSKPFVWLLGQTLWRNAMRRNHAEIWRRLKS